MEETPKQVNEDCYQFYKIMSYDIQNLGLSFVIKL